jgi:acyl dehydratase
MKKAGGKSMTTLEELATKVGQEIGVSEWIVVDQEMIDKFADATGDYQPVHNDPEAARHSPFGGTIAHGFLTLSLLTQLITKSDVDPTRGVRTVLNYGTNKVRFVSPLRSGSRIRARFKLQELVEKRPGQYQQVLDTMVEVEGSEKPALVAEWIFHRFT